MPNENERNTPSFKTQQEPLAQSPVTPPTPQQDKVRQDSQCASTDKEDKTVQLEKDIRGGERWLIGISGASVVLNLVIALIYYGQLIQMRKATMATEKAATAANSGADAAHQSAVEAGKANEVATDALVKVQRAFVVVNAVPHMQLIGPKENESILFSFQMENSGTTPTRKCEAHINWAVLADTLPDNFFFQMLGHQVLGILMCCP